MSLGREPLKPFSPPHEDAMVRTKMKQAKKAYVDANYNQARKIWQEVLDCDPSYTQAWTNCSAAYWCLKDYESALAYAEEGIKSDSSYPTAHLRKGLACIYLNRLSDACKSLEFALSIDPENQEALRSYELASRLSGGQSLADRKECILGGHLAFRIGDGLWEQAYADITSHGLTYQKLAPGTKPVILRFESITQVSTGVVRKSRFLVRSGQWYEFQVQSAAGASYWVETICQSIAQKSDETSSNSEGLAQEKENLQPAGAGVDFSLSRKGKTAGKVKHARQFVSPGASEHMDTEDLPSTKHISFAFQRDIGPIPPLEAAARDIPQALRGSLSPETGSPAMTPTLFRGSAIQDFPDCASCEQDAANYCRVCQGFFCDSCNQIVHQRRGDLSHISHQIKLATLVLNPKTGIETLLSPTEREVLASQRKSSKAPPSQENVRGENVNQNVLRSTGAENSKLRIFGDFPKKANKGRRVSLSELADELNSAEQRAPLTEIQTKPGHRRRPPLTVDPSLYQGRQGRGTIIPIGKA